MEPSRTLVDYRGTYGDRSSREEILRALKEALALVEQTARDARLSCAGLRIEITKEGRPRDEHQDPLRD